MKPGQEVKYFGAVLDKILNFESRLSCTCTKLLGFKGICYVLKNLLSHQQLLKYFQIYVKPVNQQSVLVYGCASMMAFDPNFKLKCSILKTIHFKKKSFCL